MSHEREIVERNGQEPWDEKAPLKPLLMVSSVLSMCVAVVMVVCLFYTQWDKIKVFSRHTVGYFQFSKKDTFVTAPLQINEKQDGELFQKKQKHLMNSFGHINEDKGVVRVPIKKAMDEFLSGRGQ